MSMAVLIRRRACSPDEANGRLLEILRRHPDVPFPIDTLADELGLAHYQVETAVKELEGPVASETPGAFVHFWRTTDEAVFIP